MGWFAPFRERINPGAFDEALERVRSGQDDVYALLNHDESYIIASTPGKTLDLSVDERGLVADMQPKDTQTIREMVVRPILDGDIRKMSFGFTVSDEHEEKRNGVQYRIIDKVGRLFDVSPVTFPAYPATDIQARRLCRKLGVDPSRISLREGLALRSLADSLRQMDTEVCAHIECGHYAEDHAAGDGACDFEDGCESFLAPADILTASHKGARPVAAGPVLAGVNSLIRTRLLDLEERDFLIT